jgi:undecaprenyl-diphosphatase
MLNIFQAILLGMIQGITEWLPISSSGHLVLAQEYLNLSVPLVFDVLLHFGTVVVILFVFRKEISQIIKPYLHRDFSDKTGLYIIWASIPVALVGFFLHDQIKAMFSSTLTVGVALLITGLFLFTSERFKRSENLSAINSMLIGVAQALAIIPGISRSGATISVSLLSGIERKRAASFSFLLAGPAILGATLYEARNITATDITPYIVGTLIAMLVGYFALNWLLKIITQGRFHLFAYYCWIVGAIVIALSL